MAEKRYDNFIGFDCIPCSEYRSKSILREIGFFTSSMQTCRYPRDPRHRFYGHRLSNSIDHSAPHSAIDFDRRNEDGYVDLFHMLSFAYLVKDGEDANKTLDQLLSSILKTNLYYEHILGDSIVTSLPLDVCFSMGPCEYTIMKSIVPIFSILLGNRSESVDRMVEDKRIVCDWTPQFMRDFHTARATMNERGGNGPRELMDLVKDLKLDEFRSSIFHYPRSMALMMSYPPAIHLSKMYAATDHEMTPNEIPRDHLQFFGYEHSENTPLTGYEDLCVLSFAIPTQRRFLIPPYQTARSKLKLIHDLERESPLGKFLFDRPSEICCSIFYEVKQNAFASNGNVARIFQHDPYAEIPSAPLPTPPRWSRPNWDD